MTSSLVRRNNLDVLRLGAACLVIVSHSWALLGLGEHDFVTRATRGGFSASWLGLAIFFSISGYLIDGSAASSASWREFARRRFLRLWPGLAAVVLLLVFVVGPLLGSLSPRAYFTRPGTWFYLSSLTLWGMRWKIPGLFEGNPLPEVNGSLWTLPYEATLYVVTWLLLRRSKGWKTPAIVFGIGLALRTFAYPAVESIPFRPLLLSLHHLLDFGLFYVGGTLIRRLWKHERILWYVLLAASACWFASLGHEAVRRPLDFLILPLGSLLVGMLATWPFDRLSRIGDCSYGVYILGFPVQQILVQLGSGHLPPLALTWCAIAICLPLAFLSWHLIEKPCLERKDRPIRLWRWSL